MKETDPSSMNLIYQLYWFHKLNICIYSKSNIEMKITIGIVRMVKVSHARRNSKSNNKKI